ncbi:hypothetical protein FQR65_LT16515 [Abscondita terminalis]|nr:hypothetical protein FQR65_LT16515 [Abscondita terminalis]
MINIFAQNPKAIQQAYSTFEQQANLRYGIAFRLTVLDSKTGNVIFSKNGQTGLPTASTAQGHSPQLSLDLLGLDFTFKTKLYYTGGGDPTLASPRFEGMNEETLLNKWVYAIQNAGIKCVEGSIIGDDRFFNGHTVPGGWIWTDIGNYYGAGVSGLNWRENSVGVQFKAGNTAGSKAILTSLTVDSSYLDIAQWKH